MSTPCRNFSRKHMTYISCSQNHTMSVHDARITLMSSTLSLKKVLSGLEQLGKFPDFVDHYWESIELIGDFSLVVSKLKNAVQERYRMNSFQLEKLL